MKFINIKPKDMIDTGPHIYSVSSVLLGGLHQESLIELESLDKSKGTDGPKPQNAFIPIEMLCAGIEAGIYKHIAAEDLDKP